MRRLGLACLLVLASVLAGCGPGAPRPSLGPPAAPPTPTTPPAPPPRLVAEVKGRQIAVYESPGAPRPKRTLSNPNENNAPRVFLVRAEQGEWLDVLLPVRPNGSTGWIRRSEVTLTRTSYRVKVELGAHRITVWDGAQVLHQEPIGVGTRDTPTPRGDYYLTELLQPPDPNGPYGPYAFGISGFSDVLLSFAGGPGVIGIHGTNDPKGLGKDVSHGCIRLSNAGITKLAKVLPLGTPVEIAP